MSFSIMLAVLCAALLHASWNFLVKRFENKHFSMSAVVIGHIPFAILALCVVPLPQASSLPFIMIGSLLHVGYQLFLLHSYRLGDLSQVYPLARGVAPLLVATVSVLFLHATLSPLELLAILIIGSGIISLSLVPQHNNLRNGRATALALVTGCFIAAYSIIDGLGAREAQTALGYYSCLSMVNALIFMLIMRRIQPGTVSRVIGQNWRFTLFGGGISFLAYSIVIWAFTRAPIALVTALRETSIVFALLFGVFFLRERLNPLKLGAIFLTTLGVCLLRLS